MRRNAFTTEDCVWSRAENEPVQQQQNPSFRNISSIIPGEFNWNCIKAIAGYIDEIPDHICNRERTPQPTFNNNAISYIYRQKTHLDKATSKNMAT